MTQEIEYDVFLSHNRADKTAVELLARRLQEEAGLSPFLDKWHLIPGEPWQEALEEALAQSATVAVFVGPSGISPWHNEELRTALNAAVRSRDDCRVFAVLLPGAMDEAVTSFLARRTWVDFRPGLDDSDAFDKLVAGILGQPPEQAGPFTLPDEPAPYRGLLRFEAEHARFFFGRDSDVRRLAKGMEQHAFVALVGASGSGKSSLVRAGLLPALAGDAIPASRAWPILVFTPGSQPLQALAAQLATLVPSAERLQTFDDLTARLIERADGLRTAVTTLLADRPQPVLLVVDQFEELFTLCQETPERCRSRTEQFIANLADAVQNGDGRIRVLITLRAGFLNRCLAFPALRKLLESRQLLLGPLDEPALREAIVRPAQEVGAFFEKGLVNTILQDVEREPGALPLLQHALYELWRARRGPWLTHDAYEASGGVQGALERRAQATYDALTPEQQPIARSIFIRLTALGEGVSDTRRRVERTELYLAGVAPRQVDAVVRALSDPQARLVVADEDDVEVAHEALIQQWDTLREWLEADREALRVHRHLTRAAQAWEDMGRDPGELYRGARLARANEWAEEHAGELNPLEREFLETSVAEREREAREREEQRRRKEQLAAEQRARRRLRWLAAGLAGMFMLALVAAGFAIRARSEAVAARGTAEEEANARATEVVVRTTAEANALANEQLANTRAEEIKQLNRVIQARQLAAQSELLLSQQSVEHPLSALLAVESMQLTRSGEGDQALRRALSLLPRQVVSITHEGLVSIVTFSPDGQWLATGSRDRWNLAGPGEVSILNVATKHEVARIARGDPVYAAAFSPDGRWLATGSEFNTVSVLEAATGDELFQIPHEGILESVAFSPDGQWLATASRAGTARIWNVTTKEEVAVMDHEEPVFAVTFSPDSQWLATGSGAEFGDSGEAQVWDIVTEQVVARIPHERRVEAVTFSPDGQWLATGSGQTVRIWQVSSVLAGESTSAWEIAMIAHDDTVLDVAFDPDGKWLATAGEQTARVWSLTLDPIAKTVATQEIARLVDAAQSVAFSPNGQWLATGSQAGAARVWLLVSNAAGNVLTGQDVIRMAHSSAVTDVSFSPDGRWLCTKTNFGDAGWWEIATGERVSPKADADSAPDAIADRPDATCPITTSFDGIVSPDGKWLAKMDGYTIVRVQEIATGWEAPPIVHEYFVMDVVFSPDSKWLATLSSGYDPGVIIRVWEVANGHLVAVLAHGLDVHGIAISPDNKWLVTLSGSYAELDAGILRMREIATGREVVRLMQAEGLQEGQVSFSPKPPVFSPDGKWLATVIQKTVWLWDATTSKQVARIVHDDNVSDFAFSPDGEWLVTASGRKARVWNAASGQEVARIAHEKPVSAVAFSPQDGEWLATGSGDDRSGEARVFLWRSGDLVEAVCARVSRNIAADEWDQYFGEEEYRRTCENLPVHPSFASKRLAELAYGKASDLAYTGSIEEAIAQFRKVLELDPSFYPDLDPESQAQRLAAEGLYWQAGSLALAGQIEEAVAKFQRVLELDPSSIPDLDPESEAQQLAAEGLKAKERNSQDEE